MTTLTELITTDNVKRLQMVIHRSVLTANRFDTAWSRNKMLHQLSEVGYIIRAAKNGVMDALAAQQYLKERDLNKTLEFMKTHVID